MNNSTTATKPSHSTPNPQQRSSWTGAQAYGMAAFCLLLGVLLGYLFRGSASPGVQPAALAANDQQQNAGPRPQQQQPNADTQSVLAQATAPLLDAVNKNPNDYESLVRLGDMYYDGKQFPSAIQFYERALSLQPGSPDVRTDLGTAYWYSGNADKAIAELQTSLRYKPGHAQALFNLGWVRWQGKQDPKGAAEAWQQLLKDNPNYPQRQQVEQYIAKANEHASRG
jgi:cytochrome c-type biogenesis protein CcmH/NrfG